MNFGGFQLVGSSPEILVRLRDGKITIRPIAGTRRRGKTPEEDAALEQELRTDPKEHAEHLMLLDLGRNDVGRVAMLGSEKSNGPPGGRRSPNVRVTDSFFVERYSHVMHLVSNVRGHCAGRGVDPVDVLMAAASPAGTLSGAPKVRAMQIIDELETEKRGVGFAGAVGYFGSDGSVDTCIVLRTALVKDGVMYVQAGGGVVADSDPNAEYEETRGRRLRRSRVRPKRRGASARPVPSPSLEPASGGPVGWAIAATAKVMALTAKNAAAASAGHARAWAYRLWRREKPLTGQIEAGAERVLGRRRSSVNSMRER